MYRTDAEKWKDKRFRELSLKAKAVYGFLWDNSDKAGFYRLVDSAGDCFALNCTEDEYREAVKELKQPRKKPNGETQRGFIIVDSTLWISHKIKHTQDHFGVKAIPGHISVLRELCEQYEWFKNEPEYMEVLNKVDRKLFKTFKVADPLAIEALSDNRLHKTDPAPQKRFAGDPTDEIYQIFEKHTRITQVKSEFRNNKIREFVRETDFGLKDIEKVVKNRVAVWKDDPSMKNHLNIETILKPEHFTKYLENALNTEKSNLAPSINQKRNIHQ